MSEWPEGWFRDGNRGAPGSNDPTVDLPAGARRPQPARPPSGRAWPEQPPPSGSRQGGAYRGAAAGAPPSIYGGGRGGRGGRRRPAGAARA